MSTVNKPPVNKQLLNKPLPVPFHRHTSTASDVETPSGQMTVGALRGSMGGVAGGLVYCAGMAAGLCSPAVDILGAASAVILGSAALGAVAGWVGAAFTGDDTGGWSRTVRTL